MNCMTACWMTAPLMVASLFASAGQPCGHQPTEPPSREFRVDYNLDGHDDLARWNEDHFEVRLGGPRGSQASSVITFKPGVSFDSDDPAYLVAPEGVRHRRLDHEPEGAMTGRVLHALRDFDGDGIADLAVFSLGGGSLKKMRFSYLVHFGRPSPAGMTEFSPQATAKIEAPGIPFEIQLGDFDDDGQVDLSMLVIQPGPLKAIRLALSAMFTNSIALDLHLYRMNEGAYPTEPDSVYTARALTSGRSGEQAADFPSVSYRDLDGDGLIDLSVADASGREQVYPGLPGPALFAREPQPGAVAGADG